MISFEDYLCNRNDAIDNAAYQLICAMTAQDHNELDTPVTHSTATVFLVIRLEIAKISIALSYRLAQRRETCEETSGFRLVLQDQERRDQ